jgi:2-iminoacetate synthase ThiH
MIADRRPLRLARAAGVRPGGEVTYTRSPAPADWLTDADGEGPIEAHRAAHAAGRPSEAAVLYGAGVAPVRTAARLAQLATLAAETGLLRAACPVPNHAGGGPRRPGSWGVEDLAVVAAARLTLPTVPWIRPDWGRLGAAACQVALAFGATDWVIPAGDPADPEHLAAAVGWTARAR